MEKRQSEIQDYKRQLAEHPVITPEQESELRQYRAKLARGIASATFEDKRKYLDWLKVKCIYDSRTKELTIAGLLGEVRQLLKTS